jgi:hypothetical protein
MDTDLPRPAAATPDSEYSLSIEDAAELYAGANLPRDLRTIQRYCAKGRLECRLVEIPFGEKYFVTPLSVSRHIAYIKEVRQAMASRGEPRQVVDEIPARNEKDAAPTNHGEPRPAVTEVPPPANEQEERQPLTGRDEPRPAAADNEFASRYVGGLERENEFLRGQISVKDHQIQQRDKQIESMIERDRETNVLIQSLQKMLTPLLGRGTGSSHMAGDQPDPQ